MSGERKNHGDAEHVADISRWLMESPETVKLFQELGESTADANELVRGLLQAAINSGLNAQMDAHLDYVNGDRAVKEAAGQANGRNGSYPKTVDSAYRPVDIGVPRYLAGAHMLRMVYTCVVHLIRAANRRVAWGDRKEVSKYLRGIYTAVNEDEARSRQSISYPWPTPTGSPHICKSVPLHKRADTLPYGSS